MYKEYLDGLYKEALYKAAKMTQEDKDKALIGSTISGAGLLAGKKVLDGGHLTGRERLYHSTDKKNIKGILEKGILASKATDPANITNTSSGIETAIAKGQIDPKDLANKTYMGRKRSTAEAITSQDYLNRIKDKSLPREFEKLKKENLDLPYMMGQIQEQVNVAKGAGKTEAQALRKYVDPSIQPKDVIDGIKDAIKKPRGTVVGSVPVWKMKDKLKDNPEVLGAKSSKDYVNKMYSMLSGGINPFFYLSPKDKKKFKQGYKTLAKDTYTFEGDLPAKYLKKSDAYSKLTANEVKDFIKNNPKRFAKGVGGGALALGATLYGGNKVRDALKNKEEKTANYKTANYKTENYKTENYKADIYKIAKEKMDAYMISLNDTDAVSEYSKGLQSKLKEEYPVKKRLMDTARPSIMSIPVGAAVGAVAGRPLGLQGTGALLGVNVSGIGSSIVGNRNIKSKVQDIKRRYNLDYTDGKSDRVKFTFS